MTWRIPHRSNSLRKLSVSEVSEITECFPVQILKFLESCLQLTEFLCYLKLLDHPLSLSGQ